MQPLTFFSFSVSDASIQHTHFDTYTDASTLGNKNARAALVTQLIPHTCARTHWEVYTARELQIKCPTLPGHVHAFRPQRTDNGPCTAYMQIAQLSWRKNTKPVSLGANHSRLNDHTHRPRPLFCDGHFGNKSLGCNFANTDVALTPLPLETLKKDWMTKFMAESSSKPSLPWRSCKHHKMQRRDHSAILPLYRISSSIFHNFDSEKRNRNRHPRFSTARHRPAKNKLNTFLLMVCFESIFSTATYSALVNRTAGIIHFNEPLFAQACKCRQFFKESHCRNRQKLNSGNTTPSWALHTVRLHFSTKQTLSFNSADTKPRGHASAHRHKAGSFYFPQSLSEKMTIFEDN